MSSESWLTEKEKSINLRSNIVSTGYIAAILESSKLAISSCTQAREKSRKAEVHAFQRFQPYFF